MSLIDILFGKKTKTATVARDRLQIIIAQERAQGTSATPDYLPTLRKSCWKSCRNTSTYHLTTSVSLKKNKMVWMFSN